VPVRKAAAPATDLVNEGHDVEQLGKALKSKAILNCNEFQLITIWVAPIVGSPGRFSRAA